MASNTSDFKPLKVSQMFSRLADLYPTSSAMLLWFNSIYISGLRQRESSSGKVTKQRTFISSFPVQVRTNTHIARISTNLMTEWSIDWFIDRFDDWLRDFLLLCTKSRFFCLITAVVTLLVNDPVTREQRNTTVAVLGKGSSFGVSQYFVSSENVQIRMQQFQYCANIIFSIALASYSVSS